MPMQPAFIRKASLELRRKLEELGYRDLYGSYNVEDDATYTDDILRTGLVDESDPVYCTICVCKDGKFDYADYGYGAVDCGVNEDLFLAIAALRDNDNYMQWFTNGDGGWCKCCDKNYLGSTIRVLDTDYHKASIEELIEHFKPEQDYGFREKKT